MLRHPLRSILLLSALSLSGLAWAGEPARHSADGGCPAAATEPATDEAASTPAAGPEVQVAPPPRSQPPQRRSLTGGERTRVPLRWHSFVPGMFM